MTLKWSTEAWNAAIDVYNNILRLPFLQELAAGTLPREKFNFYIGQDSLYLNEYSRVLAHIAARSTHSNMKSAFLKFAADGVAVENILHATFVAETPKQMSPTCLFYTSLLKATALDDLAVECAAILPCFWIYREVGKHIIREAKMEGNPYSSWIATYADEAFDASTNLAIDLCDFIATTASSETRQRMTEVFVHASQLELRFWQSAYDLETW